MRSQQVMPGLCGVVVAEGWLLVTRVGVRGDKVEG